MIDGVCIYQLSHAVRVTYLQIYFLQLVEESFKHANFGSRVEDEGGVDPGPGLNLRDQ